MIKTVIFDIGGVLIDFTESQYLAYLRKKELPKVSQLELEEFMFPLIVLMEYGTLTVPELERMMGKHFNHGKLNMHWVQGWRAIAKPKRDVIGLLNKLAETYNVVLLSNVSQSRFAEMERMIFPLLHKKTKVYASCFIRMRKPSPHIYQYTLKKLKAKPGETVFIDNQIENVIGAEKEGIHAVWFRGYKQLVKDLEKLKVL